MKKLAILCGVSAVALAAFFLGTDPSKVPSLLLVVPFLFLLIFLFTSSSIILHFLGISKVRGRQLATLIAAIPTLLLVLQSIGQLTWRDVLTIGLLVGISYFYISRFTGKKTT